MLPNVMVGDVVELVGPPGQATVKFHLSPRDGKASIPTAVPVKAEVVGTDIQHPMVFEVRILDGPNRDMLVDVEPSAIRPLSR